MNRREDMCTHPIDGFDDAGPSEGRAASPRFDAEVQPRILQVSCIRVNVTDILTV